jgi:hypothetical protein
MIDAIKAYSLSVAAGGDVAGMHIVNDRLARATASGRQVAELLGLRRRGCRMRCRLRLFQAGPAARPLPAVGLPFDQLRPFGADEL